MPTQDNTHAASVSNPLLEVDSVQADFARQCEVLCRGLQIRQSQNYANDAAAKSLVESLIPVLPPVGVYHRSPMMPTLSSYFSSMIDSPTYQSLPMKKRLELFAQAYEQAQLPQAGALGAAWPALLLDYCRARVERVLRDQQAKAGLRQLEATTQFLTYCHRVYFKTDDEATGQIRQWVRQLSIDVHAETFKKKVRDAYESVKDDDSAERLNHISSKILPDLFKDQAVKALPSVSRLIEIIRVFAAENTGKKAACVDRFLIECGNKALTNLYAAVGEAEESRQPESKQVAHQLKQKLHHWANSLLPVLWEYKHRLRAFRRHAFIRLTDSYFTLMTPSEFEPLFTFFAELSESEWKHPETQFAYQTYFKLMLKNCGLDDVKHLCENVIINIPAPYRFEWIELNKGLASDSDSPSTQDPLAVGQESEAAKAYCLQINDIHQTVYAWLDRVNDDGISQTLLGMQWVTATTLQSLVRCQDAEQAQSVIAKAVNDYHRQATAYGTQTEAPPAQRMQPSRLRQAFLRRSAELSPLQGERDETVMPEALFVSGITEALRQLGNVIGQRPSDYLAYLQQILESYLQAPLVKDSTASKLAKRNDSLAAMLQLQDSVESCVNRRLSRQRLQRLMVSSADYFPQVAGLLAQIPQVASASPEAAAQVDVEADAVTAADSQADETHIGLDDASFEADKNECLDNMHRYRGLAHAWFRRVGSSTGRDDALARHDLRYAIKLFSTLEAQCRLGEKAATTALPKLGKHHCVELQLLFKVCLRMLRAARYANIDSVDESMLGYFNDLGLFDPLEAHQQIINYCVAYAPIAAFDDKASAPDEVLDSQFSSTSVEQVRSEQIARQSKQQCMLSYYSWIIALHICFDPKTNSRDHLKRFHEQCAVSLKQFGEPSLRGAHLNPFGEMMGALFHCQHTDLLLAASRSMVGTLMTEPSEDFPETVERVTVRAQLSPRIVFLRELLSELPTLQVEQLLSLPMLALVAALYDCKVDLLEVRADQPSPSTHVVFADAQDCLLRLPEHCRESVFGPLAQQLQQVGPEGLLLTEAFCKQQQLFERNQTSGVSYGGNNQS